MREMEVRAAQRFEALSAARTRIYSGASREVRGVSVHSAVAIELRRAQGKYAWQQQTVEARREWSRYGRKALLRRGGYGGSCPAQPVAGAAKRYAYAGDVKTLHGVEAV